MKKVTVALAVLLGVPAVMLAILIVRDQQLKSGFEDVQNGISEAEVVQILGVPNSYVRCAYFGGDRRPGCAKEMVFLSSLTFVDVWVVSLDGNGHVIRKFRYSSP